MLEHAAQRREMVRIGRLLYDRQLVVAAEGNLSVRLGGDHFLVTPAGAGKGFLTEIDLLEITSDGRPILRTVTAQNSTLGRPSSEWLLHREIYAHRPDVGAVCHAHPPWATAFAAAGQALDGCLLPEIVATLGVVPLARFGTPGSAELPAAVRDLVISHDALLLANHGVITVGPTMIDAYFRMESVERLAQITLLARLAGGEQRLTRAQAAAVRALAPSADRPQAPALCVPASADGKKATTHDPDESASGRPDQERDDLEALAERLAQDILAELARKSD